MRKIEPHVASFTKVRDAARLHEGNWPALADRAGVSYRWLIEFMRGTYKVPSVVEVGKLASALGLKLSIDVSSQHPGKG